MNNGLQRWIQNEGEQFFRQVGLRPGHRLLDFGCGSGNYTIPAARVVGRWGRVYALDRNRIILNSLSERARSLGLDNIVPLHTLDELKRRLGGELLDAVILYDVLHSYYFSPGERKSLLASIDTLVKAGGLLSIYPEHMDLAEIRAIEVEVARLGFAPVYKSSMRLIHDGSYKTGRIFNYRKRPKKAAAEHRCPC